MLKSIRLENFKLHEKTTIDAARITVFIGPNNSGKSSVFQAVLALRQAATRTPPNNFFFLDRALRKPPGEGQPFLFEPQLIDIGNFEDVVRQDQNEVRIGVTGTVNSPRPLGDIGPIQVSV